jgi:hypothetical protein
MVKACYPGLIGGTAVSPAFLSDDTSLPMPNYRAYRRKTGAGLGRTHIIAIVTPANTAGGNTSNYKPYRDKRILQVIFHFLAP